MSEPAPPPSPEASDARSFSVLGGVLPFRAPASRRRRTWSWRQQPSTAPLRGVLCVCGVFFFFPLGTSLGTKLPPTPSPRICGFHQPEAGEAPNCSACFSPAGGSSIKAAARPLASSLWLRPHLPPLDG